MTEQIQNVIEKRIRISAILMFLGLVVEIISFLWHHPLGFVLFAVVGLLAIFLGLLIFLSTLLTTPAVPARRRDDPSSK